MEQSEILIGEQILNIKEENYIDHIIAMCIAFQKWDWKFSGEKQRVENYEIFLDAYAAIETKLLALGIKFLPVEFVEDKFKTNINRIINFFASLMDEYQREERKLITKDTIEVSRNKYRKLLDLGFFYSFSDGDLERIQELINELRKEISESQLFTSEHQERLLKKLEGLQKELHKKMSSLDKLWGFIGDAGIVLGKFGIDAKPFVDRISELMQITWRTQAIAEELPTGTPLPLLSDKYKE